MKSGNVSETCRRHGIAQTLYYRWKDEAEQGAKAALGGKSATTGHNLPLRGSWRRSRSWASPTGGRRTIIRKETATSSG
jgi:transposase-like protein